MFTNIHEVALKLLGNIEPIGDSSENLERLINLQNTIELTEALINDIIVVARHKDSRTYSVAKIGKEADDFITRLKGRFSE